jgi:hypothetical protein
MDRASMPPAKRKRWPRLAGGQVPSVPSRPLSPAAPVSTQSADADGQTPISRLPVNDSRGKNNSGDGRAPGDRGKRGFRPWSGKRQRVGRQPHARLPNYRRHYVRRREDLVLSAVAAALRRGRARHQADGDPADDPAAAGLPARLPLRMTLNLGTDGLAGVRDTDLTTRAECGADE